MDFMDDNVIRARIKNKFIRKNEFITKVEYYNKPPKEK